jgi:hypothetical protein
MKTLVLAAAATALALPLTAQAKPGSGHGHAGTTVSTHANTHASGKVTTDRIRARTDSRAALRARTRTGTAVNRSLDADGDGVPDWRESRVVDTDHNGIADWRERRFADANGNGVPDWRETFVDRNRDGVDDRTGQRYGGASCPPGLEKKDPACLPPGQAAKSYAIGDRLPAGYRYLTDLNGIPLDYRDDIPTMYRTDAYRYIYRDRSIYVVDPVTNLIRDIVNLGG